jgi:hypothetical protein
MSLRQRALELLGRPAARKGDARRRIVLFGDSHIHAIQDALKSRRSENDNLAFEARRLLKPKANAPRARSSPKAGTIGDTSFERFLSIAASLRGTDILVSVIGGNQHAVFGTIRHPVPFDFHSPEDPRVEKGVSLIPYRMLYDQFLRGLGKGDGAMLAALRSATTAKVVHLFAPPPKHKNAFIELYHDTHFAAEGIEHLGVSPPALRMKFWHLQNRVLREICGELDIEVIPPPPEAVDPQGFLERSCYAGDATHGNVKYGELVLADLERRFA